MSEYNVLDEIAHVIKRKNMYLGDTENSKEKAFVFTDKLEYKECEFNYGFIKIFDEILVNAVDNMSRSKNQSYIRCEVGKDYVSIENDGSSIPIEKYVSKPRQKSESNEAYIARTNIEASLVGRFIPEVIFTKLRSSSNYCEENEKQRITGGLNGVGAKLTAIFSKYFEIDVINSGQHYVQRIEKNCRLINEPKIKKTSKKDYVKITFYPDWALLDDDKKFVSINEDMIGLIKKRLFDYSHLDIKLFFQGEQLKPLSFSKFAEAHFELFDDSIQLYSFHDNKWKIEFGFTDKKACVISYINNVPTTKNGSHVDAIRRQIAEYVRSKCKNKKLSLKSLYPKISMCVYSIIPGATFASQAKTSLAKSSFTFPTLSESLLSDFTTNSGILEFANVGKVKSENTKTTRARITNIAKLIDAEEAGKPMNKRKEKNHICSLFVCEGDSAQSLCIRGIKFLGEQYYGSFALRGKVMNTQKQSEEKYLKNSELTNLKKAIGLVEGRTYTSADELRYQRVICCKDADYDGSLIMGLLINFFYQRFKTLILIPGFFCEFTTPVINVYKPPYIPKTSFPFKCFNSIAEFEMDESVKNMPCKFIKGLGGNSDKDIETYFKDFESHLVEIDCSVEGMEDAITLVYSNKRGFTDKRKEWIAKVKIEDYLPRNKPRLAFTDFCNIDLAQASNDTCERSIASAIDGLKPSQRKVIYTFFNMSESKAKTPIKVFQLTGKVSDFASYHHGNQSLDDVIIRMAQDFVGANNIPLLERDGQFGTRNKLGNDASASRYISAYIGDFTRQIYPKIDETLLSIRSEDNVKVEPYYYVPIIPVILINGCQGIGTGWSTSIPQFNPTELIGLTSEWLSSLAKGKKIERHFDLAPWYRNYKGKIYIDSEKHNWVFVGNVEKVGVCKYRVDEIPIGMSIQNFRDILNSLIEKKIVKDYTNKNELKNDVPDSFNFIITFTLEPTNLVELLSLKTTISQRNLVAYDRRNRIRHFDTVEALFKEWFETRLSFYAKRKKLLISNLENDIKFNENKLRFLQSVDGYDLNHKNKEQMNELLEHEKYDKFDSSFSYLLSIPIYAMTKDKIEKLKKKIADLKVELERIKSSSIYKLWNDDLLEFMKEMEP